MRILSWNVNGLRACVKKGFNEWRDESGADIVGLQETKAMAEQLDDATRSPEGWHTAFSSAEKKGYSGTGLYSRQAPDWVETKLGDDALDAEGRLQLAQFGELWVANVYFPNGSGKNRDHSRIPYKFAFYEGLFNRLEEERAAGRPIIVMGDFNTAPYAIDLARPKGNLKTAGFTPGEREHLEGIVARGWTDTFRHLHPEAEGAYSWWSYRGGVRARNVGWRIDLAFASPGAMAHLEESFILPDVMGSDHCPIGVTLNDAVLKG